MKKNIITCSNPAEGGRFGNQLFAYCFAKGLARKYNAILQWPEISSIRKIFHISDPFIEDLTAVQTGLDYIPTQQQLDIIGTIDLYGYWQFQDCLDLYSRKDVLSWLPFQDWVIDLYNKLPYFDIVVHKRRGDYVAKPNLYCNINDEYYDRILEKAIDKHGNELSYLIISEENPNVDEYCDSLDVGFLPDWLLMVKAGIVIRSNSTFSWWAPIFGNNKVISPVVGDLVGWQTPNYVYGNYPLMAPPNIHSQFGVKLTDLVLCME